MAPGAAKAARALGIDVSSYQGGSINWTDVKASGISFAWSKATEGTGYIDADFAGNETRGKAAGVYMGAYHYAHPELNTASAEANYFWNTAKNYIKGDGLTLMPMLDIEGTAFGISDAALTTWINAWCTDVIQLAANAGVIIKPAIYVSACNACNFGSSVSQWNNDIADYNGQNPQTGTPWSTCTSCERWGTGSGAWNFWQYTSSDPVSGISDPTVDHDVFNGTEATLLATMVATAAASSTIYYWDPQGTGGADPYTGSMTGTWENSKWSYGSAGQASLVGWTDGKAACFGVHTGVGTPAYTVTMNSSHVVAGFFDGALTPNSCDVTIQGTGVVNLASGPQALDSITNSDGSIGYLRIEVEISGDGQLFPEGNGQSFLRATNTYTGGTTLGYSNVNFSGTVNFNNGSAFGTGPITLWSHGNGGALVLEGTAAATVTNDVAVTTATTNNIVGNAAGLTFSGDWSLGGNLLTLGAGGTAGKQTIISGVVSGTAGLTVYNAGTVVLSGVNTYTGTTTIKSPAVFAIGDPGQLGSGAHAGNIVNTGTFRYDSSATQTLTGTISGTGALVKTNSGTLILAHAETYTGATTIRAGTLALGASGAIGASAVTVSSGATLSNATTTARTIGAATTLSSGARAALTAVGGGSSAIGKISVTGNLTMNANLLTVTVTGAALAAGNYRLLDCTGTLAGSANASPTIVGTPLASGYTAAITTTAGAAGHVDLSVKATPAFSNLTASAQISYGAPSLTLGGKVVATGPLFPASGETISVKIDGNTQTTTVNDATGDFSINYNFSPLLTNGLPYPITYSYAGNSSLNSTNDMSTTLTVNARPVSLIGTRPYDETTDAAAAILSVTNALGSDVVSVASGIATLASGNVGPEAIWSVGTLVLGGAAAGNYTLSGASGTVTITVPPFSITTQSVDITGTNIVITWQSAPGATYHMLGNADAIAPLNLWTDVAGSITATGTTTSVTIPITSPFRVFDVKSP